MILQNYTNEMYKVLKLNNIAEEGLSVFDLDRFHCGDDVTNPDAIILRSFDMHDMDIPKDLKAVGRAGSGVNNIPIDKYTEQAIPVFNAPGANSNAVKELVLASILISARNIHSAIKYVESVKDSDDLKSDIEQGKKAYVGFELPTKTLGVIGLGQIGVKVANAAHDLGMNVIGWSQNLKDEKLKREGVARDLVRAVQTKRREKQFDVSDFIKIKLDNKIS